MAIIGMSGIRYCDAMVNTKKEDEKKVLNTSFTFPM